MESSTAPAAGWFPDPNDASSERWWSGHGWTEHTRAPLGAELPEAFAPHVATLVAERPVESEAPAEPAAPFVFNMTPSSEPAFAAPATPAQPEPEAQAEQPSFRSWFTETQAPAPSLPPVAPTSEAPALPGFTMPSAPDAAPSIPPVAAAPLPEAFPAPSVPMAPIPDAVAPAPMPAPVAETPSLPPVVEMPAPAAETVPSFPTPVAFPEPAVAAAPAAFAAPLPAAPAPAPIVPDAGFVLPSAAVVLPSAEPTEAPRVGRHADVAAVPEPVKASAPAAPRPVGYTASADPEIANRYRSVIHSADAAPAPEVDPAAALAPAWPAGATPAPFSAPPAYAPSFASFAGTASNRPARAARTTGLIALVATLLSVGTSFANLPGLAALLPGVLALTAFTSGLVAIVLGIIGLVISRRARVGFGSSLAGLLLGLLLSVVLPVGVFFFALSLASSLGLFTAG